MIDAFRCLCRANLIILIGEKNKFHTSTHTDLDTVQRDTWVHLAQIRSSSIGEGRKGVRLSGVELTRIERSYSGGLYGG